MGLIYAGTGTGIGGGWVGGVMLALCETPEEDLKAFTAVHLGTTLLLHSSSP